MRNSRQQQNTGMLEVGARFAKSSNEVRLLRTEAEFLEETLAVVASFRAPICAWYPIRTRRRT